MVICLIAGFVAFLFLKPHKVSDLATDTTTTVITGFHYDENIDKCDYLVVPDYNFLVHGNVPYAYKNVNAIGEDAFSSNTHIKQIYIPKNITHIYKNAFNGCMSVKKVYFGGSVEEWNAIKIESGNDILSTVPVIYNSKMPSVNDQ